MFTYCLDLGMPCPKPVTAGHPELLNLQSEILQTIENPDKILEGNNGELLAVKLLGDNKYLVTIY
ncbi:MAG: hypothetical protein ACK5BG_15135, partial [Pseudanabaena sp.]